MAMLSQEFVHVPFAPVPAPVHGVMSSKPYSSAERALNSQYAWSRLGDGGQPEKGYLTKYRNH